MNHSLLPIPTMTRGQVDTDNALFGLQHDITARIADRPIAIQFSQSNECQTNRYIEFCGGEIACWLGFENADVLPTSHLGFNSIDNLPNEILLGVVEFLLEPVMTNLSGVAGATCKIVRISNAGDIPAGTESVGLTATFDGQPEFFELRASTEHLARMSRFVANAPLRPASETDDLSFEVPIELGTASLPMDVFEDLKPNDLIVVDNWHGDPQRDAVALFPSPLPHFSVSMESNSLTLQSPIPSPLLPRSPSTIELSIRAEHLNLPIQESDKIASQAMFPHPVAPSVFVWLEDKLITTGTLVSVNKSVAVQLLDWPVWRSRQRSDAALY